MKKKITALSLLSILLFTTVWAKGATDTKIIAYYFLTNFRCTSCYKIEMYTKEALEKHFKDELESGILVFKPANIDEKENKHFIEDYELYTKAVVLSIQKGGREVKYKNLTKIWEYLGDKDTFYDYIKSETSQFLEEVQK